QAYVVRTPAASLGAAGANVVFNGIEFTALSSGAWANGQLLIDIDVQGVKLSADSLAFNLTVTDLADQTTEYFADVTLTQTSKNFLAAVVNDPDIGSQLVKVSFPGVIPTTPVKVSGVLGAAITTALVNTAIGGSATATTASQDFSLQMNTSSPA